jgi:predicted nucleotidyltransferase
MGRRYTTMLARPTMDGLRQRRDIILKLAALHGASVVQVFGSTARDDAREDSDVDFLVRFEPGRGAMDAAGLAIDLEEELARRVDLVVDDGSAAAAEIAAQAIGL